MLSRTGTSRLIALAILAAGCQIAPAPVCFAADTVRVFEAANVVEQWINYIWLEIPKLTVQGTFPGRLFVASADPVGVIVPTMIDLPCETAGEQAVEYVPAPVDIQFTDTDTLQTSYSWKSCARCSECYMQWTFKLDLKGRLGDGSLAADLVLNETFHSGPMKIVSLKLADATLACTEPRLTCRAGGDCNEIRLEARR
ncbi:MAG TPA: hypothetical protein VIU38_13995 [Anaerolineales bacterium]